MHAISKSFLAAIIASAALAQEVPRENTQTGMNETAGKQLKAAEAEMQESLGRITLRAKDNPSAVAKLRNAQDAWETYRDAQLAAMWPGAAAGYGSVQPMCVAFAKAALTEARTRELRQMETPVEGDACASDWPE